MLLTIPETARLLKVSRAEVYRLVRLGRLPAVRLSARVLRVPAAAIDELVASAMRQHGGDGR